MSRLVTLDEVLDIISDVKDIDAAVYLNPRDGLVELHLLCGSSIHSSLLVTEPDLAKLQEILANVITFQKQP